MLSEEQKKCIELMALGHMSLDDAVVLAECKPEDFETDEAKEYRLHYLEGFNGFVSCVHEPKIEIHFYTNLSDEKEVSDSDLDTMLTDISSTKKEIDWALMSTDDSPKIIKTTQVCYLRNAWDYISCGADVFIHIGKKVYQVKDGMEAENRHEIRKGMDLSRMLLAGTFGNIY